MSTEKRKDKVGLIRRFANRPQAFGFFQAVRLLQLQLLRSGESTTAPDLTRRIRYRNSSSLNFPASEIESATLYFDDAANESDVSKTLRPPNLIRAEITPAFTGLLGASGTLPLPYTEALGHGDGNKSDTAGRAFLDLFTNRSTQLFFEAWKKYRLGHRYELDGRQAALAPLLRLAGKSSAVSNQKQRTIQPETFARNAAIFWRQTRSAETLANLVGQYFGVHVEADQFMACWYELPRRQRSRLAKRTACLGAGAVLGTRVLQCDLRLRLRLGPLHLDELESFLPGGHARSNLEALLGHLTGIALEYEIQLCLRRPDVTGAKLLDQGGNRLGADSFLSTRKSSTDRADLHFVIRPGTPDQHKSPHHTIFTHDHTTTHADRETEPHLPGSR